METLCYIFVTSLRKLSKHLDPHIYYFMITTSILQVNESKVLRVLFRYHNSTRENIFCVVDFLPIALNTIKSNEFNLYICIL